MPITRQDPNGPGTGDFGGGSGDFGGGSPGGRQFRPNATPVLQAYLSLASPDYGVTLNISFSATIKFADGVNYIPNQFTIYYLSPLLVTDALVNLGLKSIPQSILQSQIITLVDVPDGVSSFSIQLPPIQYTPIGTAGGTRDFSKGGWLFAQASESTAYDIFAGQMTQPKAIPYFPSDTTPVDASETFNSVALNVTGPDSTGVYTVNLNLTSPYPQVLRTRFADIWMYNYRGLGLYEAMGLYSVYTVPKSLKTIQFKLEKDGGGHDVTFYAVECNANRARRFGVPVSSYGHAVQAGGFP